LTLGAFYDIISLVFYTTKCNKLYNCSVWPEEEMRVLTGILQESKEYYIAIQKELNKGIGSLPKGSV